jgi:murein DD-endopeptidase MepM/ murein hydrolase activator NlpD
VRIDAPNVPVRGGVEARVSTDPAARTRLVSVRVDGQSQADNDGRIAIDTAALGDGPHRVDVVVRDTSRQQNQASASWSFVSDNTAPRLDVSLDPAEGPLEGHTAVLRVRADEPLRNLSATLDGQMAQLQPDPDGGWWLLEGLPPDAPESSLDVQLSATDWVGNAAQLERSWPVRLSTFAEDDGYLQPSDDELQARGEEDRRLGDIYHQVSGPRRWNGPFRTPVQGPITTAFGSHRSYEYHPGMDLAAAMGTPVAAPADGTVAFVGSVPARGNVVILDHGAGVYSTYAHLQRAEVTEDTAVKAGQVIASVGSTGFSTGPHLHWEVWVNGGNVDPLEWTRRSFP